MLRDGTPFEAGLDADRLEELYRFVDGRAPGAVLVVARRGVLAAERAFGVIDRSPDEPMPVNALFDLESNTKPIVAATVLSLADAGVLALADPIARWVPGMFAHATIEDALTHSSGLPFDIDLVEDPDAAWQCMHASELVFPAHTRVLYSDLGYRLLGKVVEAAAGQPLDRAVHDRVLAPLGLASTMYTPPESLRPRIAGTGTLRGVMTDRLDTLLGGVVGCDGLFASARDYAVFLQTLLAGGAPIVSPASAARMTTDQTPWADPTDTWLEALYNGPKTAGFEVTTRETYGALSPRAYGKMGIAGTFACVDPDRELIVVYFTNQGTPAGRHAAWFAAAAPDRVMTLAAAAVV